MLLQLEPSPKKLNRIDCTQQWDYPMMNLQWWRKS